MQKKVKTTLQYFVFAALGGLLLYWTFAKVNPTQMWENIQSTHLPGLLLALAIGFTAIVIRGIRWILQIIVDLQYQSLHLFHVQAPQSVSPSLYRLLYLMNEDHSEDRNASRPSTLF